MIIDIDTTGMTKEQINRVEDLMIEFSMGEILDGLGYSFRCF